MNERTKAALIGGAVIGVLSVIPFVSSCCFIWAIAGGALAVYLYLSKTSAPFTTGDGAMLGAMAGGFGAVIYLIIALPIMLVVGVASMQQALEQSGVALPFSGFALAIVSIIMVAIIIVLFALLGGLIGAAIFGKNRPGATPPPPPVNYGGTPPAGGGFGAGV